MRQIKMIRFYIGRIMRNLAVFIRWGIFSAFVGLFVGAFSTLFAFCLRQVIPDGESMADPVPAFGWCSDRFFVRCIPVQE